MKEINPVRRVGPKTLGDTHHVPFPQPFFAKADLSPRSHFPFFGGTTAYELTQGLPNSVKHSDRGHIINEDA